MQISERNKLIEENMRLVGKVIKDNVRNIDGIGIYTYDDLYQIGCVGLCNAAARYRPGMACFSTYAYILIRNEIIDALRHATLIKKHEFITNTEDMPDDRADASPESSVNCIDQALDAAESSAAGIYAKGIASIRLLAMRYSHRESGEQMGVTANNASAWVARARKYLRMRADVAVLNDPV